MHKKSKKISHESTLIIFRYFPKSNCPISLINSKFKKLNFVLIFYLKVTVKPFKVQNVFCLEVESFLQVILITF